MSQTHREASQIRPRRVKFDFSNTPLHWVPGDPYTTHLINVLHLIAPAGEKEFIKVCRAALPLLDDEAFKADLRGFMGQEGSHATAHLQVLEELRRHGIDTDAYMDGYSQFLATISAEDPAVPLPRECWLYWRLAWMAAAEQMTCVLGDWILRQEGLDAAGADPVMLELLRWHGAEEVEHREVAFELLQRIAGPAELPWRVIGMAVVFPTIITLWSQGVQYLAERDASLAGRRFTFFDFIRSVQQDRAPGWELLEAAVRFTLPWFHPSHEGSPERAAAFIRVARAVIATAA